MPSDPARPINHQPPPHADPLVGLVDIAKEERQAKRPALAIRNEYGGVKTVKLPPAGGKPKQYIQCNRRIVKGRKQGTARGGWVTENEIIRIRAELKKKHIQARRAKKGNKSRK
jgi:hypothetical protein